MGGKGKCQKLASTGWWQILINSEAPEHLSVRLYLAEHFSVRCENGGAYKLVQIFSPLGLRSVPSSVVVVPSTRRLMWTISMKGT